MIEKKQKYWVRIIKIALPIIISNLISQLQMLIDKVFLGRLELECMSAVGNATGPIWTTMNTIFSMTLGGTILISQAIGAKDESRAKKMMASMFKYNNVLALFWFVFWVFGARAVFVIMGVDKNVIDMSVSYARFMAPVFLVTGLGATAGSMLQVSEKTRMLAVYGFIRSGMNVILDYILIFGRFGLPKMGVSGAALATSIAEYIGAIIIILYILFEKKLVIKPNFITILKAKGSYYISAIKVGIPSTMEDFAWNFGSLFLIVMLNQVSAVAAGIYSIIFAVELIPLAVFNGLGQATVTLSGQETGKGNKSAVRRLTAISLLWCGILSCIILVCFIIFPQAILGLFTTDQGVIKASAIYMLIVGIDIFPKAANIIIGSGIKGFGDTIWMLKTQIFGTIFIITFSALIVLVFHGGMVEIFCLIVADETIRSFLNLWKLRKETKKQA